MSKGKRVSIAFLVTCLSGFVLGFALGRTTDPTAYYVGGVAMTVILVFVLVPWTVEGKFFWTLWREREK